MLRMSPASHLAPVGTGSLSLPHPALRNTRCSAACSRARQQHWGHTTRAHALEKQPVSFCMAKLRNMRETRRVQCPVCQFRQHLVLYLSLKLQEAWDRCQGCLYVLLSFWLSWLPQENDTCVQSKGSKQRDEILGEETVGLNCTFGSVQNRPQPPVLQGWDPGCSGSLPGLASGSLRALLAYGEPCTAPRTSLQLSSLESICSSCPQDAITVLENGIRESFEAVFLRVNPKGSERLGWFF